MMLFRKSINVRVLWPLLLASGTAFACCRKAPPPPPPEKPLSSEKPSCPGDSLTSALFRGLELPCPKAGKELPSDYNSLTRKVDGNIGKKNGLVEAEELFQEVFDNRPVYRPVIQELYRAGLEDPLEERTEIKDYVLRLFNKFRPQTELDKAILLFRAVIPPSESFEVGGGPYYGLRTEENGLAIPFNMEWNAPLRKKHGSLLPKELIAASPEERVAVCLEYSHLLVSLLRAAGIEAHANGKSVGRHVYTIANLGGQKYKLDTLKGSKGVARRKLIEILGEPDASWQVFFINPNEETVLFGSRRIVEKEIRRRIKDPIKQAKILIVFKQSQQLVFEPTVTEADTDRESIADHYNSEGVVLAEQGKIPEALEAYDKALEINPDFLNAWINKRLVRRKQEKK
ncbi:MAG: tetratricopeptide repeat protein [Candidatus Margulisiibacteriota bacterium]